MNRLPRARPATAKNFWGATARPARPAALGRARLDGRDGAGLDPCAALQTVVELAPGEAREVIFLLGESDSAEEARDSSRASEVANGQRSLRARAVRYWDETLLETVEVRTPDAALDTMLNRWLLYQTLACRVWARSAFYQSGGAYGFRDQLQDVMALVYASPDIARAQILRAAAHQFKEGDVQHWWHPPTGRGVRTRFSDDLLWLPYVTSFYISVTGDAIGARRSGSVSRSARRLNRERGRVVHAAGMSQTRRPLFTSTACARSTGVWRSARTACR